MAFVAALTFLTAIRSPGAAPGPEHLRGAAGYFPVVGLVIGVTIALLDGMLTPLLPSAVVSVLVLLALLGITGGLHLDGLADTCDAFFQANATPERRLEIMRDSHVGAYAIAGVVLTLLLQYTALVALSPDARAPVLILMATLSRWTLTLALTLFPYARPEGLGTPFAGPMGPWGWAGSLLVPAAVSLLVGGPLGILLLLAAPAALWLTARVLMTRLPGLTGDTYGAINEVVQTVVLVLAVALEPRGS